MLQTQDPLANQQLIDPVLTRLVVGQPQYKPYPGTALAPPITVSTKTFKWVSYGKERLMDYGEIRRALRADIKVIDWEVSTESDTLDRYSVAVKKDVWELENATDSIGIQVKSADLARQVIELKMERLVKTMIDTAGSYDTGHVNAAANCWDSASGDSRVDVRAACALIAGKTGIPYEDMVVFLPEDSYQAALNDPTFLAARFNFSTDTPGYDALARYWGVGRVWSANPIVSADDGTVSSLYSDIAVVYYPGNAPMYDSTYGALHWAVSFKWAQQMRGGAYRPWYDERSTSWYFPWEDFCKVRVINNSCAAKITNCVT